VAAIFAANRVAAWCGFTRPGSPIFLFPGFLRVPFWSKKWLNPFKIGSFCVPETVQKKLKK
jgi:hypothetical protein